MTSDVVLEVRGLSRSFPAPGRPGRLFLDALLGRLDRREPWHQALSGVDLKLHKGETLGILGMNGAGKTTLLSILAGILPQSSGKVVRKGQVAAVLSLGQGINPQLTGRQNALLVCRSMGMSRWQAEAALPAVADYAELGEAFDRPMRTYSSGMRSRLAFAATIQTFAEIVILDEALAVGDLMFRMKCYQTLREMRASGRSIIMVAHSPDTLASMSDRIMVLHQGQKIFDGSPVEAVVAYKAMRVDEEDGAPASPESGQDAVAITCLNGKSLIGREPGETIVLDLELAAERDMRLSDLTLGLLDSRGVSVCSSALPLGSMVPNEIRAGTRHRLSVSFRNWLSPGRYRVVALAAEPGGEGRGLRSYNPKLALLRIAGDPSPQGPVANLGLSIRKRSPALVDEWEEKDGYRSRLYKSYEDYLQHQAAKLGTVDLTKYHDKFRNSLAARLRQFSEMEEVSNVLCLAARTGAEVEAFKKLGKFAVGIDLRPTDKSLHVLHGDFHDLQFPSGSCDCVYTNSIDHAFELGKMLAEISRVLKVGGLFVAEIVHGTKDQEGREAGEYEAQWWSSYRDVMDIIARHGFEPVSEQDFSYPWHGTATLWRKI